MQTARRYEFDTVFGTDGAVLRGGADGPALFTRQELEAALAQAREEGRQSESAIAARDSADALSQAASALRRIEHALAREIAEAQAGLVDLALAAAHQIAGAALQSFGAQQACTILAQAAASAGSAPRLVLRVCANQLPEFHDKLVAAATQAGLEGRLFIEAAQHAGEYSCTVEWGEGALGFNPDAIRAEIERAAALHLSQLQGEVTA